MEKRYVITGIGAVSPYGTGVAPMWEGLKKGVSAIRPIHKFDGTKYQSTVAGEIPEFELEGFNFDAAFKRLPRVSQETILATEMALTDAGLLTMPAEAKDLMGVYLGTRNGAQDKTGEFYGKVVLQGPYRSNPLLFQETVFNSIAANISLRHGITGPGYVTPSGETGTLAALDLALLQMEVERVESALVGGVDEFCEVLHQAHCFLRITAKDDISRPFDAESTGIVFAEGAAIIIVEELANAQKRGARIYGEILSISTLNDPHSVADNDPEGKNMAYCMRQALAEAGLTKVDCLLTTANGNKHIDAGELRAIGSIFQDTVPIANIKSLMGDTGGAGGGMNIITALLMLQDGFIPAIANLKNYPKGYDFVLEPRQSQLETVMINAAGFGGNNISMIIKKL